MCTVLLPPGVDPIAVTYIISYHIISYHIISYHIISYTISYHYYTNNTPESQYRREGGEADTNCRGLAFRKWIGCPTMVHVFCLPQYYHYLSTVQIHHPFKPSPSHSANGSRSFWLSVKIFSRSALRGWPEFSADILKVVILKAENLRKSNGTSNVFFLPANYIIKLNILMVVRAK